MRKVEADLFLLYFSMSHLPYIFGFSPRRYLRNRIFYQKNVFIFRWFSKCTQCYRSTGVYWFVVSITALTVFHITEYALLPKHMVWHQKQRTGRNEHEETKVQAVPPSCDIKLLSSSMLCWRKLVFKPFWQYLRLIPLKNKFKARKLYVTPPQAVFCWF